jgi:hypothetical protein
MNLNKYLNGTGFVPTKSTLEHWAFLPQVNSSERIPSILGDIKSLSVPIFMVFLLIVLETINMYVLNHQGLFIIGLLVIMIIEFFIAFIPYLKIKLNLVPSISLNQIFIKQIKIKEDMNNGNNDSVMQQRLRNEIQNEEKKLRNGKLISILTVLIILILTLLKIYLIYIALGQSMLINLGGRVSIGVALISLIVHIAYTKDVITYYFFRKSFMKEFNDFMTIGLNKAASYQVTPIQFSGLFKFAKSEDNIIGKEASQDEVDGNNFIELKDNSLTRKVSTSNATKDYEMNIYSKGFITDRDINNLVNAQNEKKENLLALLKEIQF